MKSNQLAFTVPINSQMIQFAENLSQQQLSERKKREIYLNTLAILAVDFYCKCMEIKTELNKSYGLDNVMLSLMNTASLFIKDKGLLECRPVLPREKYCQIPPEVTSERIGYMIVEIDDNDRKARIIGFVESVDNQDKLSLVVLRPLEDFLAYLHKLQFAEIAKTPVTQISESLVKLSKWFEGLLDSGWESELAFAKDISPINTTTEKSVKQEVGGAKFIQLIHPSEPVLLILRQTRLNGDEVEIVLRLYPASESIFLLDGIQMTLLDEQDKPIPQLEKQAKASNWLQLRFKGNIGDKFSLRISLGSESITEKFVI